jgi:hypothetical protein
MRKVSLFICLTLFEVGYSFSQSVNGIPLTKLHDTAEYIHVSGIPITLSRKININIEYGQPYRTKNTRVMNDDGNQMQFNSMVEVLNFMSTLGYELVSCSDSVSSFLMRRRELKLQ